MTFQTQGLNRRNRFHLKLIVREYISANTLGLDTQLTQMEPNILCIMTFAEIRSTLNTGVKRQTLHHIESRLQTLEASRSPVMLNLGCGVRFCDSWLNLDGNSNGTSVLQWDLRNGIPLPDGCVDVIYHSHLLEHLDCEDASNFMGECSRVLRAGGTIRVVVPDLEVIAKLYLEKLNAVVAGNDTEESAYQWMVLELYDQVVRTDFGGKIIPILTIGDKRLIDFAASRWGNLVPELISELAETERARYTLIKKSSKVERTVALLLNPRTLFLKLREKALTLLLGREYDELCRGRFLKGGLLHRWMYDRLSLRRVLEAKGFNQISQCTAHTSRIADWSEFRLDVEADGGVYKPDSLYMEATKPAS